MKKTNQESIGRRDLLKTGLGLAGLSLIPGAAMATVITKPESSAKELSGFRKLGSKLQVSSIGLGVQNMARTYQTTIPSRSEMIRILQKAYDSGLTLFDTDSRWVENCLL